MQRIKWDCALSSSTSVCLRIAQYVERKEDDSADATSTFLDHLSFVRCFDFSVSAAYHVHARYIITFVFILLFIFCVPLGVWATKTVFHYIHARER
jgi:hypothetical protein